MKKNNVIISILENLTIGMILLVLVQTFLEDFVVYRGFSQTFIERIKLSAFIFDFYFTVEFFVRLISSIKNKKIIYYLFYKNGWIDFLSSIPLLLLLSGPLVINHFFHFDILGVAFVNSMGLLKLIKAIRVTRILRFLRVLKIFGKIKNVRSQMAQRHVSIISTMVIFSLILFYTTFSILQSVGILPSQLDDVIKKETTIIKTYDKYYGILNENDFIQMINKTSKFHPNIARVKYKGKEIYHTNKISEADIDKFQKANPELFYQNYHDISKRFLILFWRQDFYKKEAFNNLMHFVLIIFLILVVLIFYTRHFAQTVSDPIYVMRMGFGKRDYTLAVKIPKYYSDDDIFILANEYNTRWLPAKMRKLNQSTNTKSMLSMNDVFGK